MESRPLDAAYDPTYIGPFTNVGMDARVRATVSGANVASGTTRYKYFRRPVMPRMSAVPPSVMLAPTVANTDPGVPVEDIPEPPTKEAEIQTMYRESEAQTIPYTPDYIVGEGEDPEVLMLKDLTFEKGLPLKAKDLEMIHYARMKRDLESSLPPFTDEAGTNLRKRLMEQQEMREFTLRTNEIDRRREERLNELQEALNERDESNELVAAQRVEAIRQMRMEERDIALTKIRNKRIKVLRRLARQRNTKDPMLSETQRRDPINDYYDKASLLYAPVQRKGAAPKKESSAYEVHLRTAPMNTLDKIEELESTIPVVLKEPVKHTLTASAEAMMSKTEPFIGKSRIRAAEHRLTSAAQRSLRETKRDVEEMHRILKAKKMAQMAATADAARTKSRATSRGQTAGGVAEEKASTPMSPGSRGASRGQNKDTGRPITPDLTVNNEGVPLDAGQELRQAVVLLQRLIRGRAVQNVMYEGRMRRAELIHELRSADETLEAQGDESAVEVANEVKLKREHDAKLRSVDSIIGGTSASLMVLLNQEQDRVDLFANLEATAEAAEKERLKREVAEGGRRQREGKRYPEPAGPAPAGT
jgi:hypothetical protein